MVKVTEEEKRILREKIEARKQRERYQENEMQLPDAYDIPEGKRVWEWVRRNIFWILSVIIGLFLLCEPLGLRICVSGAFPCV